MGSLHPDEPVFTLRAQDVLAPAIILEWARNIIKSPNVTRAQFLKAAEALSVAQKMLDWQMQNPGLVKMPDLEEPKTTDK